MKEFIDKLISRLEEIEEDCLDMHDWQGQSAIANAITIVNELAEEYKGGWIPCTVVEHPEHCNDCEVTIKDIRGYSREVAFYTDKWRRASDEVPLLVVAWKEPSAPYTEGE